MRDHELFEAPFPIDRRGLREIPVPEDWKTALEGPTIQVLPLVDGAKRAWIPGWTSYVEALDEAPEAEVICGGINSKTPAAAAVWRQGNLLHFGFEQAPDELNATGRDLLVDSIAYIARFTQDRPIAHTPSVFVSGRTVPSTVRIQRYLDAGNQEWLHDLLAPEEAAVLDAEGLAAWGVRWRLGHACYAPDTEGRLTRDTDLEAWLQDPREPHFLQRCVTGLANGGEEAARARRLLARYVAGGPGENADARAWEAWVREQGPCLFFSESGGYRNYVDPLALARGVPTAGLRGPARADP